jgi:DNA-binding FadR family transcriptional regulator
MRVSEEVAEQLKQSILQGYFKAGDRLPAERDLADEFGVSRTAVRQALSSLQNTGFVMTRQGSGGGAFITDLTFDHLVTTYLDLFLANKISIPELYQVRLLVEPEVARGAAANVTARYARRLEVAMEKEKMFPDSLSADIDRKTAVHFILAEMCGNRFLESIVRSVMGLSRRIVEVLAPDPVEIHPAGLHEPIVRAVLDKDPDQAFAKMREHAISFGEVLMKLEKAFRSKNSQPLQ